MDKSVCSSSLGYGIALEHTPIGMCANTSSLKTEISGDAFQLEVKVDPMDFS